MDKTRQKSEVEAGQKTRRLRFLHAADLHLGVSFKGLRSLSESWRNRLLSAVTESYGRLVKAAIEHRVDFVLIAGDVFDSARISYADHLNLLDGLKKLEKAGISAYLCAGNHDPLNSWQQEFSELPANTHLFGADKPDFAVYEREGESLAIIGGRSFASKAWQNAESIAEGITREAALEATGVEAPYVLGLVHTGLNIDYEQAPVEPAKLLAAGMDYWALGHIHEHRMLPKDRPVLAYSGCIQGRSINETGRKGVLLVTLEKGRSNKVELLPTASVVWEQIEIDAANCSNIAEIGEKIAREMVQATNEAGCEDGCVRVTLTGKSTLHAVLALPGVIEDLRKSINDTYSFCFCDAIIDKTTLPLDKEALRREGLFPSVFLQVAQALREDKDEAAAIIQDELLTRGVSLASSREKDVGQLVAEAEDLVLDLLGQGEQ